MLGSGIVQYLKIWRLIVRFGLRFGMFRITPGHVFFQPRQYMSHTSTVPLLHARRLALAALVLEVHNRLVL